MKSSSRPSGRDAIKAWHRQKILDATVEVINRYGIAGTTIARVVSIAEVSMGLVNVHFRSKQALLFEVLRQMAEIYRLHWRNHLGRVGNDPVSRLNAMLLADFDAEVLNLRTLGVWFAFRAQAHASPEYLELAGMREAEQMQEIISLIRRLNHASGQHHDPAVVTRQLAALVEGLWTEYYLYPQEFDHHQAMQCIYLFLEVMYPGYFKQYTSA